jgi:putative ABC transport system permease protein
MRSGSLPRGVRLHGFAGIGARSLRARPLRSVLTTAGIVLGVGMAFGVLILVTTIHSSFSNLFDAIYGNTSVIVSGKNMVGSVPEKTLGTVQRVDGVEAAVGGVNGIFRVIDEGGEARTGRSATLFVGGADLAAPDATGTKIIGGHEPSSPREIELEKSWASTEGVEVGDRVHLATPSGPVFLRVSGIYSLSTNLDLGGYGTATMGAAALRALTGKKGVWDEINVIAADGVSPQTLQRRIDAVLGPGIEVTTPAGRGEDVNEQLAGLDIVLYFFSGMAIFVGAFLILNSFNMTVLQRMREIGTLRALGGSRRRVAASVVGEAMILALVGCLLGLGLGLGLAEALASAMRSSFGLPVAALDIGLGAVIVAVAVGLLATFAGSLYPALRAGRVAPIRALTGGGAAERPPGMRRLGLGIVLFLPGLVVGGLFWFSNQSGGALAALVGVGSTVVMFVGMVLLAPFVVMPLIRLLAFPARALMPAEGRLAADSLRANPLRTSATAAALVVTLSVVVVNSILSASFVGSINDELDARFGRDLTVQPAGYSEYGPPMSGIDPSLRERIAGLPSAGVVTPRRIVYTTHLPGSEEPGLLTAVDPRQWSQVDHSQYEGTSNAEAMAGLAAGGAVIGKGLADDTGLGIGDTLPLAGPAGSAQVPIVATVDTLEGNGNLVTLSLATMKRVYGIETDSVLAVNAASPAQRALLATEVSRLLGDRYPGFEAVSNDEFKQQYTDQINQQFAFFNAIIGIAVVVGLLGIINTLSMSVLERTREIGVLRALGGSRWRIRRTMLDESLLISLAGTLAGIGAGLLVGVVWLLSIRESTLVGLSLRMPTGILILIGVLGVVIGTLAAVLPARRAAHLDPLQALTYE